MLRFRQVLVLGLLLGPAVLASAESREGIWKGKLRRRFTYDTRHHQAVYEEVLDLTLLVGQEDVSGHASAHLSSPVVTRTRNDNQYARWMASYEPADFGVTVKGRRTGEGNWLQLAFTPTVPVKVRFSYQDGQGANTHALLELLQLNSQQVPWTDSTIAHFLRHQNLSPREGLEVPPDLIYFAEGVSEAQFECSGGFTKVDKPPIRISKGVMLGALMVYLGLILPVLLTRAAPGGFLTMLGTLVGTLNVLEGFGLSGMAHLLRAAGFAVAAFLLVLEGARLLKARRFSAFPLAASLLLDAASFAAAFWGMEWDMNATVTAGSIIGRRGAIGAAVIGAALLTYGIQWVTASAKRSLSGRMPQRK